MDNNSGNIDLNNRSEDNTPKGRSDTKALPAKKKEKKDKWENYEYSPAAQPVTDASFVIGLCLRALCVVMLTFGLAFFLDDAFSLDSGTAGLLFKSILTTAIFSLIIVGGKIGALIGLGVGAVSAGITAIAHPGVFGYFSGCIAYTKDSVMKYLVHIGYDNYSLYITNAADMGLEKKELHSGAMTVLILALSLIFSLLIMRKTFLIPTLTVSGATMVLGFTFNTSSTSVGFAFAILALCGIAVMRVFDGYFKAKHKDRRRLASLGGYVGGSVMLLALLTIMIPVLTVTDSWDTISFISAPIEVARDVVDSVITGDAPNLKDMGIIKNMDEFNSRDAGPKELKFNGETLITVETSYPRDIPIYMRGWVATSFDGSKWSTVTNDQLANYNSIMKSIAESAGYTNGAYRTENMTEAFYQMVDPSLRLIDEELGYTNNYENGFISMYLNVRPELGRGMGNLVYLPSVSAAEGLRKYGDAAKAYKYGYRSYFDGMLITGWLNLHKEYTVRAYAPIMSSTSFGVTLEKQINYYKAMKELMIFSESEGYTYAAKDSIVEQTLIKYGLSEYIGQPTYFDSYLLLSDNEKAVAYAQYVTVVDAYTEYAKEAYGKSNIKSNGTIGGFVDQIYAQPSRYGVTRDSFTHDKVLAVIKYLNEHYDYTMTPESVGDLGYDGFLRKTREGYYVQFATTAALMLQSMGITARYAEGYIAADFKASEDGKDGVYTCTVTDQQAHAWVEVYYEGYGWLPYETTAKYMKAYYGSAIDMDDASQGLPVGPGGGIGSGDSHAPENELPGDTELPPEELPENLSFSAGKALLIIAVIIGSSVAVYFVVKKLKDRADSVLAGRRQLITDAINKDIDEQDIRVYATQLNEQIFEMFAIGGYSPTVGELPREFAARMEKDSLLGKASPFGEIMALIQKQEFGNGVTPAELARIAEYLDSLWKDVYRSKNRVKQIWHRYILCNL